MLGHLSLGVDNLDRAMRFYDAVMAAIGCNRLWSTATAVGYGIAGGNDRLALFAHPGAARPPGPGFHVAFAAPDRAAVDRFYATAMINGGRAAGAPGPRKRYGPTYYAAFVIDPDGHKIEAVHQ
jgi:catechol 2,3-dioxygenase-like lactoylglutathione lyase family enzyme